jgi:predicted oxidoreductase
MSNMSYCRFYNTLNDLRDCEEHFSDMLDSKEEIRARRNILELCRLISKNYTQDDLNDYEEKEDE